MIREARRPFDPRDQRLVPALPGGARVGRAIPFRLTPREQDVLERVTLGRTNREIATDLFISEKTASVHVSNIKSKLAANGRAEIAAIAVRLENLAFVRPMPHDLIAQLLSIGGMRVERVAVTSLRDDIFHGSLWVRAGERVHELDVRPSDAITVAMDAGAPILVTEETFEQARDVVLRAGAEVDQLEALMRGWIERGKAQPEAVARAYRSFRSLPLAEGAMVRPRS